MNEPPAYVPAEHDLTQALESVCVQHFAGMLVAMMEVIVQKHPDHLRSILSSVFDVTALELSNRQAAEKVQATHTAALNVQILLEQVSKQIDALERRLDAGEHRTEALEERQHNGEQYMGRLARLCRLVAEKVSA